MGVGVHRVVLIRGVSFKMKARGPGSIHHFEVAGPMRTHSLRPIHSFLPGAGMILDSLGDLDTKCVPVKVRREPSEEKPRPTDLTPDGTVFLDGIRSVYLDSP